MPMHQVSKRIHTLAPSLFAECTVRQAFLQLSCGYTEQAEQLVQTRVCVQSSNRSGIINVLQLGCATTLHSKHY